MPEWRELTWDDAIQRSYEALAGGEALYDEIDAEPGRSNIDIESTCGALTRSSPERMPGYAMARELGGAVASAATASWQRDCRYENPPPSPYSRYAVRLCRLPLPT